MQQIFKCIQQIHIAIYLKADAAASEGDFFQNHTPRPLLMFTWILWAKVPSLPCLIHQLRQYSDMLSANLKYLNFSYGLTASSVFKNLTIDARENVRACSWILHSHLLFVWSSSRYTQLYQSSNAWLWSKILVIRLVMVGSLFLLYKQWQRILRSRTILCYLIIVVGW